MTNKNSAVFREMKVLAYIDKAMPDYEYDPDDFEVYEFKDPNENFIGKWNEDKLGPIPTIQKLRNIRKIDEDRIKDKQTRNKSESIRERIIKLEEQVEALSRIVAKKENFIPTVSLNEKQ